MKTFILGIFVGAGLLVLAGYLFVVNGGIPMAVKSPVLPFEEFIAKKSIENFLKGSEKLVSPVPADEVNMLAGAKEFVHHCAVCHGYKDGKPGPIAKGLFPPPPQLLEPDSGEVGYPAGSVFWTIKKGMRLTGMPGFEDHLTDTEVWQIAQMLIHADKLPPNVANALVKKK